MGTGLTSARRQSRKPAHRAARAQTRAPVPAQGCRSMTLRQLLLTNGKPCLVFCSGKALWCCEHPAYLRLLDGSPRALYKVTLSWSSRPRIGDRRLGMSIAVPLQLSLGELCTGAALLVRFALHMFGRCLIA